MRILFVVVFVLLIACQEEQPVWLNRPYSVPAKLQPYLTDFVKLAEAHGIAVDTTSLLIIYGDLPAPMLGEARPNEKMIVLDTMGIWHKHNMETVIFHEFGHLLLLREHDNTFLNGTRFPKSIMNCCDPPMYYGWDAKFRNYYVEELFNPNTPCPDWAN